MIIEMKLVKIFSPRCRKYIYEIQEFDQVYLYRCDRFYKNLFVYDVENVNVDGA